jgi:hypothetical protein
MSLRYEQLDDERPEDRDSAQQRQDDQLAGAHRRGSLPSRVLDPAHGAHSAAAAGAPAP